ncbi:MAG: hypothetical protein H0T42_22245 [Deltaproteobacteria bacterium]|nr:hypothetical protein [Deltaproteobacteria bacterium]
MRSFAVAIAATGCSAVTSIEIARPAVANVAADTSVATFALMSHEGKMVRLFDALSAGHVVLVFYRGHW